ncbi:hypothetical protein Bpfe_008718 [Biomphalaria pfeifferi]|uniref:Uncharacterized protein n=1 Tax=Biomphalaria pfeifferi TaxID=112525 RepID=A0AAD8FFC8_BIOPF|nr:hypothetical protein Bpfe_008718 [Biomphalaria pfeifferi]
MEPDKTPYRTHSFEVEQINRNISIYKRHPTTKMCRESRWPYTDQLTPQEIACLRDSYCGCRKKTTCVEYVSNYDRINNPVMGYDQRLLKDNMFHKPTVMISARKEERTRKVNVEVNMSYGRYRDYMIDNVNLLYPREFLCHKQFTRGNGMRTLPPLNVVDQPRAALPDKQNQ